MTALLLAITLAAPPACDTTTEVDGGDGWCLTEEQALEHAATRLDLDICRHELDAETHGRKRMEWLLTASQAMDDQACTNALDIQRIEQAKPQRQPGFAVGIAVGVVLTISAVVAAAQLERPVMP